MSSPLDIPWLVLSSGGLLGGGPGDVLLVGGVVAEAAVEDADEPVAEGAEGLVVGGAGGSFGVVEVTGLW